MPKSDLAIHAIEIVCPALLYDILQIVRCRTASHIVQRHPYGCTYDAASLKSGSYRTSYARVSTSRQEVSGIAGRTRIALEERPLEFSRVVIAIAGGFIATVLAKGFGVSSWAAQVVIFLGIAAATYFSIAANIRAAESKWWQI
jgi:hypothetical protein